MKTAGKITALPQKAAALAALIPRSRFDPAVLAWAGRAAPRSRWGIAFSGGPDSLALLFLVWSHWPERRRRLFALHFDHRLRGAESRGDAAFCRRVCAALAVPLVAGRWEGSHADASEAEARTARMKFFAKHARVVWLGHQQDDVAESMLMRLARGSGTGGLAAPRPVQPMPQGRTHLRPLLTLKKAEIVSALREAGIAWREDSSNAGAAFLRNRVRRQVIPAWLRATERDALAGAARSRLLLEEDDTALEWFVDRMDAAGRSGRLSLKKLAGKPRALWRRALHRWVLAQPGAADISRQAFDALLGAIERGQPTRHSLGREGFAVVRKGRLCFEHAGKPSHRFQRCTN